MDQSEADRTAWLAEACQGDELLRGEVDELLRQHQKPSGALDSPPEGIAKVAIGLRLEGRRLGAWEVLREIGGGGMGAVYLARRADGAFQMQAAIKVLNAPFASDELRQRFRQEREILAQLSHPNIARLLDGGTTEDGLPYLVMEFVDGKPITDYCDEQRASIGERLELLEELCLVVDYLHENKVIHRDLKPANVLVGSNGKLKLLDFGISKLLTPLGEQTLLATRSGVHLLTPEYASPEQVKGEAITPRTDIYALGVMTYELLSGHRPHSLRSNAMNAIMRAICEDEPERPSTVVTQTVAVLGEAAVEPATVGRLRRTSPQRLSERLRDNLDEVIMKALRKEPAQRYRSARELGLDLSAGKEGRSVLARGDSRLGGWLRRLSKNPYPLLLSISAVLLIGSGAVTLHAKALVYGLAAAALLLLANVHRDGWVISRRAWYLWLSITLLPTTVLIVYSLFFSTNDFGVQSWQWLAVFGAVTIPFLLGSVIRWLLRERWAGKLLVDASAPLPLWFGWLARLFLLLVCPAVLFFWANGEIDFDYRDIGVLAILLVNSLLLLRTVLRRGKLEFRERGIASVDLFRSWNQIAAWNWENGFGVQNQTALRLKLRRPLFRRSVCLPVSLSNMDQVSSVLREFVSDSPQQEAAAESQDAPKRALYSGFAAIVLGWLAIYAAGHEPRMDQLLAGWANTPWLSIRSLSRPEVKRNTIDGLDYAWIAPGSFTMGCSQDDGQCKANEKPAHRVTITRGFWIGTTPVTNAAFQRCLEARLHRKLPSGDENPTLPKVMLSWVGAKQYCEWAGNLRLPTEAEWEYAARAGTTGPRYGLFGDIAAREGSAWPPYPVARKQPNAWGLYDVLGNVREWVEIRTQRITICA